MKSKPELNAQGFTLIELIVVITLISIMLFFAVPKFGSQFLIDESKATARWIMINVPALKARAVRDHKLYALQISFSRNKFWIINETMSEEEQVLAEEKGYDLPEGIRIIDVEYPGDQKITSGLADIYFYAAGYSDKALIHLGNDKGEELFFHIEPFLSKIKYSRNAL